MGLAVGMGLGWDDCEGIEMVLRWCWDGVGMGLGWGWHGVVFRLGLGIGLNIE